MRAPPDTLSAPQIGAVLAGKYEVERVLGSGAMGVVVAAEHQLLRHTVAIKLIAGKREDAAKAVLRFTREARAIAGLVSDHIVRVLDFGLLEEGQPFLVMQYLRGHDLACEVRERGGKLPPAEAVDLVIQACDGLATAHAAGVIHRDIKPGNLVLTQRPNGAPLLVIVDFGISKSTAEEAEETLTASQATLGSPLYMSPEQIRDPSSVDARTDVWSLGVVLRFLLTGKPAFVASDASGVLAAVIADEPTPLRDEAPEVDEGLADVVGRCLEKRRAFRFGSAAELARALAPYASEAGAAQASRIADAAPNAVRISVVTTPAPAPEAEGAGTFASTTRGPAPPPVAKRRASRALIGVGAALGLVGAAAFALTGPEPLVAKLGVAVADLGTRAAVKMTPQHDVSEGASASAPKEQAGAPDAGPAASDAGASEATPASAVLDAGAPVATAPAPRRARPLPPRAQPPHAPPAPSASDPLDTAK
jgi:serine/threonine-protein kinase